MMGIAGVGLLAAIQHDVAAARLLTNPRQLQNQYASFNSAFNISLFDSSFGCTAQSLVAHGTPDLMRDLHDRSLVLV